MSTTIRRSILAAILLACALPAQLQTTDLHLFVRDRATSAPLPGAMLALGIGASWFGPLPAGADGCVVIADVPMGRVYSVIARDLAGRVERTTLELLPVPGECTAARRLLSFDIRVGPRPPEIQGGAAGPAVEAKVELEGVALLACAEGTLLGSTIYKCPGVTAAPTSRDETKTEKITIAKETTESGRVAIEDLLKVEFGSTMTARGELSGERSTVYRWNLEREYPGREGVVEIHAVTYAVRFQRYVREATEWNRITGRVYAWSPWVKDGPLVTRHFTTGTCVVDKTTACKVAEDASGKKSDGK